jgi:hypothetical protein
MGKNNKRNRSNNSTTGLTPPTKTIANMASPNQQQQQQQSFSNSLNQAHETLYTSTPMNTCQRLPLAVPYQQILIHTRSATNQLSPDYIHDNQRKEKRHFSLIYVCTVMNTCLFVSIL